MPGFFDKIGGGFFPDRNDQGISASDLSSAQAWTAAHTWTVNSIGTAQTPGGSWINSTAAAAGAQQYSPMLVLSGQGWKTDATAASQEVAFAWQTRPVQGSDAPTGLLDLQVKIGAGAYSSKARFDSTGKLYVNSLDVFGTALLMQGNTLYCESLAPISQGNTLGLSNYGQISHSPVAKTSGSPSLMVITGPAHTTLTASAEATDLNFNLARTVQFAQGALATQRAMLIQAPTYSFATGGATLSTAVTVAISAAPAAGTNTTLTRTFALRVGGDVTAGPTSAGFIYRSIDVPAHTVTVSGTTQATSVGPAALGLGKITITSGQVSPIDNAATLYIEDAPAAAGSATITNRYAIWVDYGLVRLDGNGTHYFEIPGDATDPTGAGGPAAGRVPINVPGVGTKYLAYY